MGKIEGIKIKNYGPLKEIVLGRTLSHKQPEPLGNMITIIGPSGNGKSTLTRLGSLQTVSNWGLKRHVMRTIAVGMIN